MPSGSTYVPPHLRGRSGASSTPASSNSAGGSKSGSRSRSRSGSNTGSGSGSGGGNSGSRWKNLNNDEDASGYTPGHRGNHSHNHRHNRDSNANRHRTPRAGGNGQAAAAAASGSGSRWANVDRSSIEAGGPSVSSNRYKKGDGYRRTNGHQHQQQHQHVRAIFFGDSFIKLFGLLNDYSDSVLKSPRKIEVHKYKAASAKGLCRDGNQNRADIRRIVHKLSRGGGSGSGSPLYPNLERLVFCFGSVDVHMSYYYKKYVQETPLSDDDLKAIARNYVDFVAGLEVTGSTRTLSKLVVGIYPSPLEDEHVGASLKAYGSLETDEQVETVDASDDRFADVRLDRVLLFNDALRERCEHHNNNNSDTDTNTNTNTNTTTHARLEYHDVLEEVLAPADEEGTRVVRDAYRDVSDLNIHLIHETILQLWVEKWPWYKALTLGADRGGRQQQQQQQQHSSADFLEYLQKTFDDYRKTKPWAERTHVAETMGVQLSAT